MHIRRIVFQNYAKVWLNTFRDKVIFSDESKFNPFVSDKRHFMQKRKGTRSVKQNLIWTIKHGHDCFIVWGMYDEIGNRVFIGEILNKYKYPNMC